MDRFLNSIIQADNLTDHQSKKKILFVLDKSKITKKKPYHKDIKKKGTLWNYFFRYICCIFHQKSSILQKPYMNDISTQKQPLIYSNVKIKYYRDVKIVGIKSCHFISFFFFTLYTIYTRNIGFKLKRRVYCYICIIILNKRD